MDIMNNDTLKLLEDCRDTFKTLLDVEFLKNIDLVMEMINELNNAIKNEING
jgi:ribosomal protein S17E